MPAEPVCLQKCEQFQDGLVSKAHRLVCHSTLGLRVIMKKKSEVRYGPMGCTPTASRCPSACSEEGSYSTIILLALQYF